MKTETEIFRYSPKPLKLYTSAIDPLESFKEETWNLLYLVADMEDKSRFTKGRHRIPAECWRTVHCGMRTGAFSKTPSRMSVAHLLSLPPQEFVDWAKNSPIAAKLPISSQVPNWIEVAQSRVHLCRKHPDAGKLTALDNIEDTTLAQSLLSKFM